MTYIPMSFWHNTKRVDFINDNLLYVGEARAGSLTSAAVWQIRKVTIGTDGDIEEIFADGSADYTKIWDNRTSLTYS